MVISSNFNMNENGFSHLVSLWNGGWGELGNGLLFLREKFARGCQKNVPICACPAFDRRGQSRPQSSSLSLMTEGEKSSGEPWNRRLSHWFSRRTKNTHLIGSFKWKVCLTLFSASAAYYNMRGRKSFLLLEILVINSNGIKRSRNTEEIV